MRVDSGQVALVRQARRVDAQSVVQVIDTVCAEQVHLLTKQYVPTPQWEAVLLGQEQASPNLLLVPVIEQQVVGWCRAFGGTFAKNKHIADIGIGLLAPFRQKGIGTEMLRQAVEWAKSCNIRKLTADTFSSNEAARSLFRKVGFVETGIRRRQFLVDEQYVDEILLERFLDDPHS